MGFDPNKHPHKPAGSPGGTGGEFESTGGGGDKAKTIEALGTEPDSGGITDPVVLYRGVEGGTSAEAALRHSPVGDLGAGVYLTPSKQIAESFGGGPGASVGAGTRSVHQYELNRKLTANEVARVFGGKKVKEDVRIFRGDGTKLYDGAWGSKQMEAALSGHPNIKIVVGTPNSIGLNQVAIRDPSIIRVKSNKKTWDDIIKRADALGLRVNDPPTEADIMEAKRFLGIKDMSNIVHKTHAADVNSMEFVLSDETPDRMDDIIVSDGWDLAAFRKNPIALFNHKADFPIGKWSGLRVSEKQLRGHLELAPAGTSARIDEIRKLIDAGILKAVSVGFKPLESKRREKADGYSFTRCELVETSLVSVPANPNALAIAKGLKISPATLDLVFAGQGTESKIETRGIPGGQAVAKTVTRKGNAMTLSQRIQETEKQLVERQDKLQAFHDGKADGGNYSDDDMETVGKANAEIARDEKLLAMLKESERNMGKGSDDGGRVVAPARSNGGAIPARPFAMPKKQMSPIDLFCRAGALMTLAHSQRKSIDEVCRNVGHGDDEQIKAVLDWQTKAASTPATTTVTHWAIELVQAINASFMETLMPQSVFPRLSGLGLTLSFGRNGRINVPTRDRTPTIAGSFVGEGLPIPVRQGSFTSVALYPKKMAVITTWTREIDEHSIPAIQALLRDAIQQDTAVALDAILLDANASTTIRPPGLLNGVSGLTPTAGGGFTALVGDIKQLTGALLTGTAGNVRSPVWLMNPLQANSIGLIPAPSAGIFPFAAEITSGRLVGWPVIVSGTVPATTVVVLDAADFVSVSEGPRFEVSDQATLHMEDTTPTDISTSGTAVAFPAKSMFQTDSMALRLILPMNWTLRRTGVVAWLTGATW